VDWNDAMDEAKQELGYSNGEYIKDWDELIELAHFIQDYENELERDELSLEYKIRHQNYLKSERWIKLRLKILFRDGWKCVDCKKDATEVHHLTYDSLYSDSEEEDCISLCNQCHKKRHNILEEKDGNKERG
jgi:5-methylcytosine-specific restriction endonuclease McrA